MKNTSIAGLILIVVGILMLVYQGFSYTTREKVLDIGPIEATAETEKTVPIPPILGWVLVGSGAVVLVAGSRGKR